MQIDTESLARHLTRQLAPLYVVYGEETLLAIEAADRIRAAALAQGYTEREVLTVEPGFEWRRLWAAGASLSLFAQQRLVELRFSTGTPGAEGGEALIQYAAALPQDTLTLVTLPKLERKTRETKWFVALESAGIAVEARKVNLSELPAWLAARLKSQGQSADAATLEFLCARVEGNLLAAHQEIRKLGLLFPAGPLSLDAVREAVVDVARYNVFDLGPAVLNGEAVHFVRMLDGLRGEGEGLPLILWALAEEARTLLRIRAATEQGVPIAQAMRDARVWGERQKGIPKALRRVDTPRLEAALRHAARIDRMIKGIGRGDPWDELRQLGLRLADPRKAVLADIGA
ncbi:MAG: DNA polymerase III subunit delta [Burkholderiales bacterium]